MGDKKKNDTVPQPVAEHQKETPAAQPVAAPQPAQQPRPVVRPPEIG